MHFATPQLLLLLLLIPPLALWQWRAWRGRRVPALLLSTLNPLSGLRPNWRVRSRIVPYILRLAAIALLVIAAARPQKEQRSEIVETQGIDIAIALDVSGSMTDGRLSGRSSLQVAQEVAAEFVRGLDRDRVGLVVFKAESRALSPLIADHKAMAEMIGQVQNVPLSEGTAIGLAMAEALNLVKESPSKSRAVVLLTDGENNSGEVQPLEAARLAQALKIRIYTVGVINTRPGAPISVDEQAMREIANLTEGQYYRATDADVLANIYNQIAQLEKARVAQEEFKSYDELAAFFLAPAFGLVALEILGANTIWRRIP